MLSPQFGDSLPKPFGLPAVYGWLWDDLWPDRRGQGAHPPWYLDIHHYMKIRYSLIPVHTCVWGENWCVIYREKEAAEDRRWWEQTKSKCLRQLWWGNFLIEKEKALTVRQSEWTNHSP